LIKHITFFGGFTTSQTGFSTSTTQEGCSLLNLSINLSNPILETYALWEGNNQIKFISVAATIYFQSFIES
jgi:hypothetical protein